MNNLSLAAQTSGAGDTDVAVAPQSTISVGWPHESRSPGQSSNCSKPPVTGVLPDPAICRAKPAGFADYADCLVEGPFNCRHALSFGYGFFCRHPQRNEIIMRTFMQGE